MPKKYSNAQRVRHASRPHPLTFTILCTGLFILPNLTFGQRWHTAMHIGAGNYSGDIVRIPQTLLPAAGVDVFYWWRPWTYVFWGIQQVAWQAKDYGNGWHTTRNLAFTGFGMGFRTGLLVTFFRFDELEWRRWRQWSTPFLTTGLYIFAFQTWREYRGQPLILRQYGTEGQLAARADYPPPYSPIQGSIFLGAGYWYRLSERWSFQITLTHYWAWTDYIDDVSNQYPDPGVFARYSTREEEAYFLSYGGRTTEMYILWGRQRGFTSNTDYFATFTVSLVYTFWAPRCPFEFPTYE